MTNKYTIHLEKWEGRRTDLCRPNVVAIIKETTFDNPLNKGDGVYLPFEKESLYVGIVRKTSHRGSIRGEGSDAVSDAFVLMDEGDDEDEKFSPKLDDFLRQLPKGFQK